MSCSNLTGHSVGNDSPCNSLAITDIVMPTSETSSSHEWEGRLAPANSANEISAALQALSSQSSVSGVSRRCLELLGHDSSDVRLWASEALESAVQPAPDEAASLIELLDQLIQRQASVAKAAGADLESSELADQLYWTATMIGRMGVAVAAADATLGRLEKLGDDPRAAAFHAAAARAGRARKAIGAL